jgi:hypothetical protein
MKKVTSLELVKACRGVYLAAAYELASVDKFFVFE